VIEVQKRGGAYQWVQTGPQITTTPLPPGKPVPPAFASCAAGFRSTG